jgi:uncharacterized protein
LPGHSHPSPLAPAATGPRYAVDNLTRGLTLATEVAIAGHSAERRRGLLGQRNLAAASGLWIAPCEAVHTFGMKMPLDILFLGKDYEVKKTASSVPPWRFSLCFSAHSVLELAPGRIASTGTRRGDRLSFRPGAEEVAAPGR